MRSVRMLFATLTAASLVLTACGGDEEGGSEEAAQATEAEEKAETWPLTGLEVDGDGSAEQPRPVLVLKMDNTESSAPQKGLGTADLVVEELVEGGMTRLAAFFYSEIPGEVGPVRSMRASDIGIVSPVDGAMVTSGAASQTIARIKGAEIPYYNEGAPGFFRDDTRSAPYNLFTNLDEVAEAASQAKARPDDYLPWGTEKDLPKGQPASTLAASFSGGSTTNWTYADGRYTNENTFAAEGDEFPADTVLVLRVKVGDAGYTDPAGNPVPETQFEGTGEAMIFHGGSLVRGTWRKPALDDTVSLSTRAGKLEVPAGRTWIELVPQAGDVTFAP